MHRINYLFIPAVITGVVIGGWITDAEYDRFYQSFREQIADIDTRLGMLQEAEDNYYITAKYLLELANRAYDLFISSEVTERRQLVKLVLSNLRVEGKTVRYDALKPFDEILNCSDRQLWLPSPWINITKIIQAFQNLVYIGELRERWNEIKKLQPSLAPQI